MTALKLGIPSQAILFAFLFTPGFAQAQSARVSATQVQGLKFKAQTMRAANAAAAPPDERPSGFFPTYNKSATMQPVTAGGANIPIVAAPQAAQKSNEDKQQMQQLIQEMQNAIGGGVDGMPTRDTNWDKFNYSDDQKFSSGQVGAGNIGNGLCTAKNENRTQVKQGYCQMLSEILNERGSCANREMNNIIILAEQGRMGEMDKYCSTFKDMTDRTQQSLVFVQILSGLIVQESGWNTRAVEPQWYKNGYAMGGKGLFQIGVNDVGQDRDCAMLNTQSIFDPRTNMKCGACIALKNAARDATMGHGVGDNGARGMARYFGPFRDGQKHKREAIAAGADAYCKASTSGNSNGPLRAAVDGATGRSTATAN